MSSNYKTISTLNSTFLISTIDFHRLRNKHFYDQYWNDLSFIISESPLLSCLSLVLSESKI